MNNLIESKLWKIVDLLRGNMSAEEYVHFILGILTLKYYSQIKKINYWNIILVNADHPEIGTKLNYALVEIEESDILLNNIFIKKYDEVDQKNLSEIIKILGNNEVFKDNDISKVYEYFLGKFFRDRGQKGGEFYTPKSVTNLIVDLLKPRKGKIYDPTCGTAGILIQAKNYIKNNKDITLYGQEYNNVTWKLAKLNLLINGIPLIDSNNNLVLGEKSADTLLNDQHDNLKFDYIMANPPFNVKNWNQEQLKNDKRFKWGLPPSGNANYAFLSHILAKLNDNGKAAVVLANGSLSSSQKQERLIRENFVNENKIDAIIELPDKLFYTTAIPACIWIFNNNKQNDNILMISASNLQGNMISKKLRELTEEDIIKISDLYTKHLNGEIIDEPSLAKTITKKDLIENDFSFVSGRYLSIKEVVVDKKALKEEIKVIGNELIQLFDEFSKMGPSIQEAIKKVMELEDEN